MQIYIQLQTIQTPSTWTEQKARSNCPPGDQRCINKSHSTTLELGLILFGKIEPCKALHAHLGTIQVTYHAGAKNIALDFIFIILELIPRLITNL